LSGGGGSARYVNVCVAAFLDFGCGGLGMVKKHVVALVALAILLAATVASEAQVFPGFGVGLGNWAWSATPGRAPGFYADLGFRKYINSFASFQFPSENGAGVILYDPLSRLEYPLTEWFWGIKLSQCCSCFTFNAEFWAMLNKWGGGKEQDSDWEDGIYPTNQKTTFSQEKARLPQSYLADFSVEAAPLTNSWARIAGIAGWRWQNFRFRAYGPSWQYSLFGPPVFLPPGDGLEANYYFKDWFYLGGKGYFNFGLAELALQADYGWLKGQMHDRHFLRGDFQTLINGNGTAWHLSAMLTKAITNVLNVSLEYDFKRITVASCTLQQLSPNFGPFPGGKLWSDQQALSGYIEYRY